MESREFKIIVTSLTPDPIEHIGKSGGFVRMMNILKRIRNFKNTRVILIAANENQANVFRKNGIEVEAKTVKSNLKFKNLFGLCLKSGWIILKAYLFLDFNFLKDKQGKIIVYSSSDLFWEVLPAFFLKSKNSQIEWVQVIHHIYPSWRNREGKMMTNFFGYYFQKISLWLIKKKADKIILVNTSIREELQKMGFGGEKLHVLSNGIDFEYFDNIKKAEIVYDGIFLGRMNSSKGVLDIPLIWKAVCEKKPGAKLAIIGGSGEKLKTRFAEAVKSSNMQKNIDVLGFLENDEAFALLKSAKVFVFPSHEEGWGIAIAEAMACGLPVVAWNLPVYYEIYNDAIITVTENKIESFAEIVTELLKNNNKRAEIGEKGKGFIKKYSWDEVVKREMEVMGIVGVS